MKRKKAQGKAKEKERVVCLKQKREMVRNSPRVQAFGGGEI